MADNTDMGVDSPVKLISGVPPSSGTKNRTSNTKNRTSGYYTKRRSTISSRLPVALTVTAPTAALPSDGPLSPAVPELPPVLQVDLSSKPRDELVRMCGKLFAELSLKNRIIHDMRTGEPWQATVAKASESCAQDHCDRLDELTYKGIDGPVEDEEAKIKLFQTLLHFKKTLVKSRESWEAAASTHKAVEVQKEALEKEVAHLRSLVATAGDADAVAKAERARVQALERQLSERNKQVASMSGKLELWARSSRRNQEARVHAEASLRTVEQELKLLRNREGNNLGSSMSVRPKTSTTLLVPLTTVSTIESQVTLGDEAADDEAAALASQLESKTRELGEATHRIAEMEQAMQEIGTTLGNYERETTELEISNETLKSMLSASNSKLETLGKLERADESELVKRIKQLESEAVEITTRHSQELAEFREKLVKGESGSIIEDLQNRYASLEREKLGLESEKTRLARELELALAAKESLEKELKLSEARRELSDEEASKLSISVMELEGEAKDLAQEKEMVEASLGSAQSQVESLRRELETSEQVRKALGAENSDESYQKEIDTFTKEKKLLEEEVERLNAALRDNSAAMESLLAECKGLQQVSANVDSLEKDLQAVSSEKTRLEQELKQAAATHEKEIEKFKEMLDSREQSEDQSAQNKEHHIKELSEELKETNQLVVMLEDELDNAKAQIEEFSRWNPQNWRDMEAKLAQAKSDLASEQEENQLIMRSNDELQDQVEELKSILKM